jgi:hypothetical protein
VGCVGQVVVNLVAAARRSACGAEERAVSAGRDDAVPMVAATSSAYASSSRWRCNGRPRHHARTGAPRPTSPSDDAAKTWRSPGVVLVASVQLLTLSVAAVFVPTMICSFFLKL